MKRRDGATSGCEGVGRGDVKERVRIKKVDRYTQVSSCARATDVNENKESPPSSDFLSTVFNQQMMREEGVAASKAQNTVRETKKETWKCCFAGCGETHGRRRNAAENERNPW